MAEAVQSLFVDLWQSGIAGQRVSDSKDALTERLRNVLLPDTERMLKTVTPNPVENGARGEAQEWSATGAAQPTALLPQVLPSRPAAEEVQDRFRLLQKWEGTVTACSQQEFTAVLREKGQPDQEATFDLEEVPEGDRELIVAGAVFHWSIGYRDRRGQRSRESIIRFRRLPAWTRRELERADQEADEIIAALHWGEPATAR